MSEQLLPPSPAGEIDFVSPYMRPSAPAENEMPRNQLLRIAVAVGRVITAPLRPKKHGYVLAHRKAGDYTKEYIWR